MTGNGHAAPLMLFRARSADKRLLKTADALFHGFHVDATLQSHMATMVREMGKPFIVDPTTYLFVLPPDRLKDSKTKEMRNGPASLAERFGSPFHENLGQRPLLPTDFPPGAGATDDVVRRVLAYQRTRCRGQMTLFSYYDKYTQFDGGPPPPASTSSSGSPAFLIPPYFQFRRAGDPWYVLSLQLADRALALKEREDRIAPVVHVAAKALEDAPTVDQIVKDFGSRPFNGCLIWVNGVAEEKQTRAGLRGLVRLVQGLSGRGQAVFKLYGGYFSMLLVAKGLTGFTCGLGFGASKNAYAYGPRDGPPSPKYYVPKLHRTLEFADAETVLKRDADLRCDCKACQEVFSGDMEHFRDMAEGDHCERHFLNARQREVKVLLAGGVEACLKDLATRAEEFEENLLVNVSSLRTWREVLAET